MMERRIGIWAAILFLVIAGRGCSGGQADGPLKAYLQKFVELVVSDPRKAVEKYWAPDSWLFYNISLVTIKVTDSDSSYYFSRKTFKLARVYALRGHFQQDLSDLNNGILKNKMKEAKANVLFSSNRCLLVEANQDSHIPYFNFLYQLILDGDAESPRVKEAFILGGQKRDIVRHSEIFERLKATIEKRTRLSDILTDDGPLLALQVLDGECEPHSAYSEKFVTKTYKDKFLSLFGESDRLEVAEEFEGDKHIQFEGDITRTSGELIYTFLMAATVVGEGFDKRVQSIHIIVQKEVAKDSGKPAAKQLRGAPSHSAKAMQIYESPRAARKRERGDDTDEADHPSEISKVIKEFSSLGLSGKK